MVDARRANFKGFPDVDSTTDDKKEVNSNENNKDMNEHGLSQIPSAMSKQTSDNVVSDIFSYTTDMSKLVLIMVGLPARGKTFISRKISNYLSWLGIRIKSFNIGAYRRVGAKDTVGKTSANYFDPSNADAVAQRHLFAKMALKDLAQFLIKGGQVAILDGTNTTKVRRRMIRNFFTKGPIAQKTNAKLVFVSSECNDEKLIEQNIINVKLRSPDYAHVPPQEAVRDFQQRIEHYKKIYEPVDNDDGSYIRCIDAGKQVTGYDVKGYLPARILFFLMHLNLSKVPIFITRHGESENNVLARLGGDTNLSKAGQRYAKTMADWIQMQPEFRRGLSVWCSTLARTMQTAKAFNKNVKIYQWKALCEIDAGIFDGWTYEEIREKHPKEYAARGIDKLGYRYPQGESYKDVIQRLEPVIFELERSTQPVIVVAHRAVARCLYAYFVGAPLEDTPYLDMKLHTVYKLSPNDYTTECDKFTFGLVASKPLSRE